MLDAFLRHHARRIAESRGPLNALYDCHVRGMHSIMLHDEPGNRVRMFIASNVHELWRNDFPLDASMNLAIHPHRFDLTLIPVYGQVCNHRFEAVEDDGGKLFECRYRSGITSGDSGCLEQTGRRFRVEHIAADPLVEAGNFMRADELHTIYVPRDEQAAWLVMEGQENPLYEPVCYTANPNFDATGLYLPMARVFAQAALRRAADWAEGRGE